MAGRADPSTLTELDSKRFIAFLRGKRLLVLMQLLFGPFAVAGRESWRIESLPLKFNRLFEISSATPINVR